jgi:hypothetical protein
VREAAADALRAAIRARPRATDLVLERWERRR